MQINELESLDEFVKRVGHAKMKDHHPEQHDADMERWWRYVEAWEYVQSASARKLGKEAEDKRE